MNAKNNNKVKNLAKAEFFAPVRKMKVKELLPEMETCSYNDSAIVVTTPEGKDKIVNFCSEGYGLLPTKSIFPKIENQLKKHFNFSANYKTTNSGRFSADYILDSGKNLQMGKEDAIKPVLRILHSYNSQTTFKILFGFYRMVCSNGLWGMQFEEASEFSHTEGQIKYIVESTLENTNEFILQGNKVLDGFKVLESQKVNNVETRVEEIIESTGFYKMQEDIVERIMIEHKNNKVALTDWLIYNGFNYQLNHNPKITAQESTLIKLDQRVYSKLIES